MPVILSPWATAFTTSCPRDGAEDGVLAVEPRGRDVRDEELRAVGAGTGIGHGEQAGLVKAERRGAFIFKLVAAVAAPGARSGRHPGS